MSSLGGLLDVRPLRTSAAFRRLWISTSCSTLGHQLAVIAVLVQVWDLTDSSVAVGALGLAQAVPMVVFGLVGGALADVVDRRRLVLATTVGQVFVAAAMAAQALAGVDSFGLVLALVATQCAFAGLGAAARRTLMVALLPDTQLSAGLALSNLSFQVAMLVGPALGGVVTGVWGPGICYAADAGSLVIDAYGVLRLPTVRPSSTRERPGPKAIGRDD
ncbi:MFS transporter [Saccharomonospora sp.]|uniref:MFS transporter n=1 Tax=Saccharomonospora sp. TaxID=33913 RepID=UPI003425C7B4